MDTSKDFTKSFDEFNKNRILAVPTILAILIAAILIFTFAGITGYYSAAKDLSILKEQYDSETLDVLLGENADMKVYAEYFTEGGNYDERFVQYATEKGFDWDRMYDPLKTPKGIAQIILFVILFLLIRYYLACSSFGMITLNLKKKKIFLSDMFNEANHFFLRFVGLRIIIALIAFIPLGIVGLIPLLLMTISPPLGVVAIIAFIIFTIWYVIFISLRLFFIAPIMFVEDKGAIESIQEGFKISKGNLKQVFIVFAIIYGISLFLNSVAATPVYQSVNNLLISSNIAKSFVIIIIMVFFILLEAIIITFINIFFFYSYEDFKKR